MTLQPSQLPPAIQQFATTHNRCLQRIVWALPKIIAFVLVAGTYFFITPHDFLFFFIGHFSLVKLESEFKIFCCILCGNRL